jgi:transcriptional regulator of arginine metabolism
MHTTDTPQLRQSAILEVIATRPVHNQDELSAILVAFGHSVSQGTLSRDLRALGVHKGPTGYFLPAGAAAAKVPEAQLTGALRQWLTSAVPAQNQVVLRTPPGGASALALAIDQAELEDTLGTLAGDDTILVITADNKTAQRVARDLEHRSR